MMATHAEHEADRTAGHEPVTASIRGVAFWIGVLAVAALLSMLLMALFLRRLDSVRREAGDTAAAPQISDRARTPPLEHDQRTQRLAWEGRQRELLGTYGWVSAEDGIARIPIERAIELEAAAAQDSQ